MGGGRLQTIKTWRKAAGSATLSSGARWVTLAAFAVVSGAAALQPMPASAQGCTPTTGSNITVTCTGATVNQGPGINTGYGNSTQNGLTINVQSGASVTGTSTGIDVNNNNTINNLGTITTNGTSTGNANGVNGNGPLTVNNSGTIGLVDIPDNLVDLTGINEGGLGPLVVVNTSTGLIQGSAAISVSAANGSATITNSGTISGIVGGGGQAISAAAGSVTVTNNASGLITADAYAIYANAATVVNYGTISAPEVSSGGIAINVNTLTLTNYASGVIAGDGGAISGSGSPSITVTNFGTISGGIDAASGVIAGNVVNVTNSGTISAASGSGGPAISMASGSVINNAGGSIIGDYEAISATGNTTIFNAGTISANSGPAIYFASGGNTLTIAPTSVINGKVIGSGADTFQLGGTGNGMFDLSTIGPTQQYEKFATFNVVGATWTVTNTFAQASPWTVQSGTLLVTGDLSSASGLTVSGGTLGGTGTVGNTQIDGGGTLAPGSGGPSGTLAVKGSLVFETGSSYAVQIAPGAGNNSKTAVVGSADLGGNGTVIVTPAFGRYATVYQILTTTAGLTGTFAGLTVNGNFAGSMMLDYTTNPGDVDLDVFGAILLATPSGANQNQQNVLNGINNAILGGYTLPPSFAGLGNISGPVLLDALSQLSGEAATGAERSAFQLMTEFLGLMLDPFADGRSGGFGSSAISFAPDEQASLPPDIALAYASVLKATAPSRPASGGGSGLGFDQRWTAWGSAYGGSSSTNGDPAAGSTNVTTQTYGFAGGMDYHVSPFTVAGFALAGAGTNWGLANALGSGRSDAFQFGAYSLTWFGPAYIAGALAFTNHWFTTNRSALGDQLTANFDGQSYGARFEGGYRYALLPAFGVTPYGALQVQDFQTPSYSESDVTGGGFGLSYAAMNATDIRSELGARFDDPTLLAGMPLILRGRLAWAHDWVSNPSLSAAFESLPGSSFAVNGAPIPQNSALASAGAQLFFTANWSLLAKFDGEFAPGSQTYGGSGTLRYRW
jgi:uncharacterized protein with beta-barrel porin domain